MKNKDLYPIQDSQAKPMEMLDEVLLRTTKSAKSAVQTMVAYSNTTQEAIANDIGSTQYSVSRFINGNRGMNINEIENFINSCGNLFLLQYLAGKYGKKLVDIDSKEARIKELEYLLSIEKRTA
jgi:hypothetical protein